MKLKNPYTKIFNTISMVIFAIITAGIYYMYNNSEDIYSILGIWFYNIIYFANIITALWVFFNYLFFKKPLFVFCGDFFIERLDIVEKEISEQTDKLRSQRYHLLKAKGNLIKQGKIIARDSPNTDYAVSKAVELQEQIINLKEKIEIGENYLENLSSNRDSLIKDIKDFLQNGAKDPKSKLMLQDL